MSETRHTPGPWTEPANEFGDGWGWINGSDGTPVVKYRECGSHAAWWPKPADKALALAAPDLLAALVALTTNPHMHLGDHVYEVREREGLGWDGPSVTSWSNAVESAEAAIKKATTPQPPKE